ncbi:ribonuclease H-like domain-containing protein [Tanacetum coccineum]|uniref:Ribonuclease H-like domain-containing protein n=1 Tax=Tanacetum coccineum TaxID=301880 RepID=A0ABQ5B577_9ASTR
MTDLGPLNYFLGISATRTTSGIFLSQTKYATESLEREQMLNYNPCRTPVDTEKKLGPEGSPPHLNAMKRVLRYLRGTTDLGLELFRSTTSQLIAYSDADWAGRSGSADSVSSSWLVGTIGYFGTFGSTSGTEDAFAEYFSCHASSGSYSGGAAELVGVAWRVVSERAGLVVVGGWRVGDGGGGLVEIGGCGYGGCAGGRGDGGV